MKKTEICAPSDTILKRAKFYADGDFGDAYELYSEKSELRTYFTKKDSYVQHVANFHSKHTKFVNLTLLNERERGNLAEIEFLEHFIEKHNEDKNIRYYTIATLVNEKEHWRILREKREILEDT